MLTKIELSNYRGFEEHSIVFNDTSIIIGQNNAGKTTIVEALRLISMITQRYKNSNYYLPPEDSNLSRRNVGLYPSMKHAEISFNTVFHQYAEPPAKIVARFIDGSIIDIHIFDKEIVFATIQNSKGKFVTSKQQAHILNIPEISIMPQVAPLQRSEKILSDDYVKSSMSSRLAPLHFRNQLRLRYDLFPKFKKTVEETWPGVMVHSLIGKNRQLGEDIFLEIRNEGFVAEIAEMGHGLQMWLQTIWFLTLAERSTTVILDEPDVYMHADLQRRIVRHLRNKFKQTILTTHSVEIMSEVLPEELLIVNKKAKFSSYATDLPAVQQAIDRSGSVHNIHLARLLSANKILLVEGDDLKILKSIQDILFPHSEFPIQAIPNMAIGGWTGWKLAMGTSLGFKNALGQPIQTYCILDSDYHTDAEIEGRLAEARESSVELHIWHKKEIENYLLSPTAIQRFISSRAAARVSLPSSDEIKIKIIEIAESMSHECHDSIANEYHNLNRKEGLPGANKYARNFIARHREINLHIVDLVSGKSLLSKLSSWTKSEFGVSISTLSLVHSFRPSEVEPELRAIITSIENCEKFTFGPRAT